jgi:DNA-directed RNA polymerase specialized sigma24 family protein
VPPWKLAYFGGKTSTEVAELEGIPVGTAKTRIRTALLRLSASRWRRVPNDGV